MCVRLTSLCDIALPSEKTAALIPRNDDPLYVLAMTSFYSFFLSLSVLSLFYLVPQRRTRDEIDIWYRETLARLTFSPTWEELLFPYLRDETLSEKMKAERDHPRCVFKNILNSPSSLQSYLNSRSISYNTSPVGAYLGTSINSVCRSSSLSRSEVYSAFLRRRKTQNSRIFLLLLHVYCYVYFDRCLIARVGFWYINRVVYVKP